MLKIPATVFCFLLIFYLFWIDRKSDEKVSSAVWIPFIWLFFSESRSLNFWLGYLFHIGYSGVSHEGGNPVDATLQTILIVLAVIVLSKRKLNWGEIFTKNTFMWLYFLFGLISITWSDFSFVAFKRLIKTTGTIIMALIILTEEKPFTAIGTIIRRLAFIFLPLSVLFIRYYPEIGRFFHSWSGDQAFLGVATSKNGLGGICLVVSMYFAWNILFSRRVNEKLGQRMRTPMYVVLLPMLVWLFYLANSATPLVCIFVAIIFFLIARLNTVKQSPNLLVVVTMGGLILFGILEWTIDFTNDVIIMLGRRPDLTTRVPMWEDLLSMVKNPLIGFGYESFWLGDRLVSIQERWGNIIQAHNGYIETYLNVGGIGLSILILWILSGFKKILTNLAGDYITSVIRLCLIVIICMFNYTEASFYGTNMLWLLFLLATIDVSNCKKYSLPPMQIQA